VSEHTAIAASSIYNAHQIDTKKKAFSGSQRAEKG